MITIRHSRLRFNDEPFMSPAERGEFKRMKSDGRVTVFDIGICAAVDCEEEVPKRVKTYCSAKCYSMEEGHHDEEEAEEEAWGVD